jgi:hypothetical protein
MHVYVEVYVFFLVWFKKNVLLVILFLSVSL